MKKLLSMFISLAVMLALLPTSSSLAFWDDRTVLVSEGRFGGSVSVTSSREFGVVGKLELVDLTNGNLATLVNEGVIRHDIRRLILKDVRIDDLSPLANLKHLEYLIIEGGYPPNALDLTPLAELTNLIDLEICSSRVSNVDSLSKLPNLQDFSLTPNSACRKQVLILLAVLPPCCDYSCYYCDYRSYHYNSHFVDCEDCHLCKSEAVIPTPRVRGHVHGDETIGVKDALAILRYVVGLPSVLDDCEVARMAALVISSEVEGVQIDDALQILRHVVGLSSVFDE